MNQQEFKERYEAEKPIYEAWGEYVKERIVGQLSKIVDVELFIKIKPEPRVKDTKSIIAKAFLRGKNYTDPYNNIEDKVGLRFVVLLVSDIKIISDIITDCGDWTNSKDRDFQEEREKNPTIFEYQSVHFVVKNKQEIMYNKNEVSIKIPENTPCEIQIRTLLQHAYSELTHNTIYKPRIKATSDVYRKVARSMALIETTDTVFGEVNDMLYAIEEKMNRFMLEIDSIYSEIASPDNERNISSLVYDAYHDIISGINTKDLAEYIERNPVIGSIIKDRYNENLLYRQSIIILVFYLIFSQRYAAKRLWPLTQSELEPIFTDLGYAFT